MDVVDNVDVKRKEFPVIKSIAKEALKCYDVTMEQYENYISMLSKLRKSSSEITR